MCLPKKLLTALAITLTSLSMMHCISITGSNDDSTQAAISSAAISSEAYSSTPLNESSQATTSSVDTQDDASENGAGTDSAPTSQDVSATTQVSSSSNKSYTPNSSSQMEQGSTDPQSSTGATSESSTYYSSATGTTNEITRDEFLNLDFERSDYPAVTIDEYDIMYELQEQEGFYNNYDPETDSDTTGNGCVDAIIMANKKDIGNGLSEILIINADISDCLRAGLSDEENLAYTTLKYTLSEHIIFSGPSDAISWSEYPIEGLGGTAYLYSHILVTADLSMSFDGLEIEMQASLHSKIASQDDPSAPCVRSEEHDLYTNCNEKTHDVSRVVFGYDVQLEDSYKEMNFNNLKVAANGTFYTEGSIDFIIENWTGTMAYGDTPESEPEYVISNGTIEVNETLPHPTYMSVVSKRSIQQSAQSIVEKLQSRIKNFR